MSDFHRMELLHLNTNQLIERCITFEHLNAEKIDEIERLRSENASLRELVGELVKALNETNENSPVFYIPCCGINGFNALIQKAQEVTK